jgi:cytochrome c-type biogenesis protein
MGEFFIAAASAVWLGILTSISPCPLATNIAAISFVARDVDNPRRVLLSGFLYTAGRTAAYVTLAMLLVASLLSAPHVSYLLQKYMNKMLGPLLILVGMFLLDLIRIGWTNTGSSEKLRKRAVRMGVWGPGLLGIVFALSFCPVSAALYFGSLLPLALENHSKVIIPSCYGVGTALPVVAFAAIIAWSAGSLGRTYNAIARIERWVRGATGIVFIGVGIYMTMDTIFGLIP